MKIFIDQNLNFKKYYKFFIFLILLVINISLPFFNHSEIIKKNSDIIIDRKTSDSFINYNISDKIIFEKNSRIYWERRYAKGGNSGAGSYNNLAIFKASIINNFVTKNNIKTFIEWGSGDCNQLSLSNYEKYIGYDVSQTAINICRKKFNNDNTKTFILMDDNFRNENKADLSISLDVIYHLLEDNVFDLYMQNLFNSSNKYICIYSSNINKPWAKHVKHRKFTDWIDKYMAKSWKLKEFIPNKYPFDENNMNNSSFSDFYFYEKIK